MRNLTTEIIALSNYADFSRDGKLSIIGVFDRIFTDQVPSSFLRGFLVFSIAGAEKESKFKVLITIKDSNDKDVLSKEIELSTGPTGKGNFIAELVGFPLPTFGEYSISLESSGGEIGKTNFYVTKPENGRKKEKSVN